MADITLIGAGPVGSLLALALAQRGHVVTVFERRPDMRTHAMSAGRSINLAVSRRGIHALAEVGLADAVLAHTVPMVGRQTHAMDGDQKLLRYGRDDGEHISSMSRGGLNQLLMTHAEATGRVKIHFSHRVIAVDLDDNTLTVQDEATGHTRTVHAGVLLGTDGSASALRQALVDTGAHVHEARLSAGYKELTMPAVTDGSGHGPDGRFALHPNALHIWPRGQFMVIALANPDGTFTCTLFLAHESTTGPSFADLRTDTEVDVFFRHWFADFVPLVPDFVTQFQHAPLGHMATVKAWPWGQGTASLVGDAAHAIVPFFGQGMNCGFEDVTALMALLDAAGPQPDWPTVLRQYEAARKPNTDAIADLAVENFTEMRDKVADPQFLLQRAVEQALDQRLAGAYRSRYQLVTFTRVPYQVALAAGQIQARVLAAATAGKMTLADVDLDAAEAAMRAELLPLLASHDLGK